MAIVKLMYPIVSLHGKMGTSVFVNTPAGTDLQQRIPIQKSGSAKARLKKYTPCLGFKTADKLYSNFSESEKQIWRDAVKKPRITGYTLWMKECLYLWGQGLYSPLRPSISGGYTYEKAITGGPYPPPSY